MAILYKIEDLPLIDDKITNISYEDKDEYVTIDFQSGKSITLPMSHIEQQNDISSCPCGLMNNCTCSTPLDYYKKLLIHYISVGNMEEKDVDAYIEKSAIKLRLNVIGLAQWFIPVRDISRTEIIEL